MIPDFLELIIHEKELNSKTGFLVDANDAVDNISKIGSSACRRVLNGD